MKCLSVSQPFANLIVLGKKTIELRRWNTSFRGELLIHAPLKVRSDDCKRLRIRGRLPRGAIVGKVELYDVKTYHSKTEVMQDSRFHHASKQFRDCTHGFMLKDHKPFRIPIPYKGRLGIFDVSLPAARPKSSEIISDIIDQEYRYGLVGHH